MKILIVDAPLCVAYLYADFYTKSESIDFTRALSNKY